MNEDLGKRIAALSPAQRRMLQSQTRKPAPSPGLSIPAGVAPSPAPASSNQEYLWMLDQRCGGNPGWNVFTGAEFIGPLDVSATHWALLEIARRHEVARTVLRCIDGTLRQVIQPELDFPLPIVDLREFPAEERLLHSRAAIAQLYRAKFDLSLGPLIRPALLRLAGEHHQLLVIMHHTITDWVSFSILNREMAALYRARTNKEELALALPTLQYRDYAFWEKNWELSEEAEAQTAYWRNNLRGAAERPVFPADNARPAVQTFDGARHPISFDTHVSGALIAGSRDAGVTPFITVLAALAVLLRARSGCEDVTIGSPVIGRLAAGTQDAFGLFLNHLALRIEASETGSFRLLLARAKTAVLGAYANQQVPFGKIVRELCPNANAAFTPLFQVMFFYLAMPRVESLTGLEWRNIEAYGGTSRYDLLFSLWERPEGISGFVEYNTDLFQPITAARIGAALELMLIAIARNFDVRVTALAEIAWREFESTKLATPA
jgi:hypothetical protein